MLYDGPDPYTSPHKLVFIYDAEKVIKTPVETYFPNAFHSRFVLHLCDNYNKKLRDLRFTLNVTHGLAGLLKKSSYKYTIPEFNDEVRQIRKLTPPTVDFYV